MRRGIVLAILGVLVLGSGSASAGEPATFAVIVAHNQSADGSLAPLQYADDDGARYAELLGLSARHVTLLSVMDADTQSLHPKLAAQARMPSRSELEGALKETFRAVQKARDDGRRTIFYFIYVGHGSVGEDGEGAMHLAGGRFSRADLFQEVLAESPATINHVIIDACHAYLMVARRGGGATETALKAFLKKEGLSAYPNTGVLLSTSRAKEVHEWSRFSAGIFSHEVRSAMVGAADVNADGAVTYAETRAFISAANARVDNPQARLEVYASPPAIHLSEPLFSRAWTGSAPRLKIPASRAGRWYLEDERGVRYADFNSAPTEALTLTLVPQPRYFLRSGDRELEIPLGVQVSIDAGQIKPRPVALAMRGSEAVTFQRDLFALPFGQAYYEGYRAATPAPLPSAEVWRAQPTAANQTQRWVALGLGGAGTATLVTGLGFAWFAGNQASNYKTFIGDDDDLRSLESSANNATGASRVLLGTGAGLLTSALILYLWPDL
jgi:hypothetical protein